MTAEILEGDARAVLATLPEASVHAVITSPPYYGLRAYKTEPRVWANGWVGELGSEPTPEQYVANLVEVFRAVRRVLRPDGTLWLVIGDSMSSGNRRAYDDKAGVGRPARPTGLGPKQCLFIPHRVALALQQEGWTVRSDCVWSKPNCLTESVTDRPTKSHEYVFLCAPKPRYYYDRFAVLEGVTQESIDRCSRDWNGHTERDFPGNSQRLKPAVTAGGRNRRSVWRIPTQGSKEAHYAGFPEALVRPLILCSTSAHGVCASCGAQWRRVTERQAMTVRPGPKAGGSGSRTTDGISGTMLSPATSTTVGWEPTCRCKTDEVRPAVVLDPFAGTGTTLAVAFSLGRDSVGIELQPKYETMARRRLAGLTAPLMATEEMSLEERPGSGGTGGVPEGGSAGVGGAGSGDGGLLAGLE